MSEQAVPTHRHAWRCFVRSVKADDGNLPGLFCGGDGFHGSQGHQVATCEHGLDVGVRLQNVLENVEALIADLKRIKPASSKGIYVKRVTLSTTMGPGLVIDQGSLDV